MEAYFFAAFLCLVAGRLVSRGLAAKQQRLLSPAEQARLQEGFAKTRLYAPLGILIPAVLFFAIPQVPPQFMVVGFVAIWVALLGYVVGMHWHTRAKLCALGINETFRRAHARAQWPSHLGWAIFLTMLVAPPLVRFLR